MILKRTARRHERHLRRVYFRSEVEVLRPVADGTETSIDTYRANVQGRDLTGGQLAQDITAADADVMQLLRMYLPSDADVEPGDRVRYAGKRWQVLTLSTDLTATPYVRLLVGREEIGTAPIDLTFYRRRDGVTSEVGTFEVRMTQEAESDNVVTGTIVGGADLDAVVVDDWFAIDQVPGQIISKNPTSVGRIELGYRRQVTTA